MRNPVVFAAYCPGKIYPISSEDPSVCIEVFGFTLAQDNDGRLDPMHFIHFFKSGKMNEELKLLQRNSRKEPHNIELRERIRVMQDVGAMFDALRTGDTTFAALDARISDELQSFRRMYYIGEQPIVHFNTEIYEDVPSP